MVGTPWEPCFTVMLSCIRTQSEELAASQLIAGNPVILSSKSRPSETPQRTPSFAPPSRSLLSSQTMASPRTSRNPRGVGSKLDGESPFDGIVLAACDHLNNRGRGNFSEKLSRLAQLGFATTLEQPSTSTAHSLNSRFSQWIGRCRMRL